MLRQMSRSVAWMLEQGKDAALQATIVKDLGALYEQEIPDIARRLIAANPDDPATRGFCALLAHIVANVPAFSLRGGTREILRGIIARGLGLR